MASDKVDEVQPVASTSRNPQLGPSPWFTFPTPPVEAFEDELPPPLEGDNVPMGDLLGRMARHSYGDLRDLIEKT
jgi:mediator of RNA polymerase II transcription subunit 14